MHDNNSISKNKCRCVIASSKMLNILYLHAQQQMACDDCSCCLRVQTCPAGTQAAVGVPGQTCQVAFDYHSALGCPVPKQALLAAFLQPCWASL